MQCKMQKPQAKKQQDISRFCDRHADFSNLDNFKPHLGVKKAVTHQLFVGYALTATVVGNSLLSTKMLYRVSKYFF